MIDGLASQRYFRMSFIAIFLLSILLAVLKMYLLRRMHDSRKYQILGNAHHTRVQEQYVSKLEESNHRLQNISTVMLFVVSVPATIFIFIMAYAITDSIFIGILFALITYAAMIFALRTRVFLSQ